MVHTNSFGEKFAADANDKINFMFFFSLGREYHKNDPAVTVDYNTADPVVRWDSYENFNERYQDSLEGKSESADGALELSIKVLI